MKGAEQDETTTALEIKHTTRVCVCVCVNERKSTTTISGGQL